MKRLELFEWEDQRWLPGIFRDGATSLIVVFHKMMGTADVVSELILAARKKVDFNQVVDMGSGSGGAMPAVLERIKEKSSEQPMNLLLTDLHPNPTFLGKINDQKRVDLRYSPESTNATKMGEMPEGLKTMIASFHHLSPENAKNVLRSAQNNRQPLLIYEVAKNNIPFPLWLLFLPLSLCILVVMSMLMTPFVRPLTFGQLFFTYLIPIIPLIYAWDGQASLMRTYTFEDLEILIGAERSEAYEWKIADGFKKNGKKSGYFVLGVPLSAK